MFLNVFKIKKLQAVSSFGYQQSYFRVHNLFLNAPNVEMGGDDGLKAR